MPRGVSGLLEIDSERCGFRVTGERQPLPSDPQLMEIGMGVAGKSYRSGLSLAVGADGARSQRRGNCQVLAAFHKNRPVTAG